MTSKSNAEETECNCNHLTHFAVLFDYGDTPKVISNRFLKCFNPIQPGLFFASLDRGGGLRRPYPCNAATAYCMTHQFTLNDVVIISSI